MFKNSFYIKAGKKSFYIRSLKSKNWIKCNSTFETDDNNQIKKLIEFESNISTLKNKWNTTGTMEKSPFNHSRVVMHEIESLVPFVQTLLNELKQSILEKLDIIIFHIDYNPVDGLADIELREIRIFLEFLGARSIYIVNPEKNVSVDEVEHFYGSTSKIRRKKDDIFWH